MLYTCSLPSITPFVFVLILIHPLICNQTVVTSGMIFPGMLPDSASIITFITLCHFYLPKCRVQVLDFFFLFFYSYFTPQYLAHIKKLIRAYVINKWLPSSSIVFFCYVKHLIHVKFMQVVSTL